MCIVLLTIMQCKECGPTSYSLYNNKNTQWNFDKVYIYIHTQHVYITHKDRHAYTTNIHTQVTVISKKVVIVAR